MSNPEIALTLDEAVKEVLSQLYGLDLNYRPELDRYRSVTRMLNKALRLNALEREWSYYAAVQSVGTVAANTRSVFLPASLRPRIINDDAVRLVRYEDDDSGHEHVVGWAYFLPRDAIHKYEFRKGLWCSITRQELYFSRYFTEAEDGLDIVLPVMREPLMFRLPEMPEDPNDPIPDVPAAIREQEIDFAYPDVIVMRAAALYAATDPVSQPRVQTLEAMHTDLRYQIIEREDRHTDSPYLNEFTVPIQSGLHEASPFHGIHPHSDERR